MTNNDRIIAYNNEMIINHAFYSSPTDEPDHYNPFPGQKIRTVHNWTSSDERPIAVEVEPESAVNDGNIVTSESYYPEDVHRPVLDIDMDVEVLPSTTPGHHHVFIDKTMTWEQYCKLLDVLQEVGILEEGYVRASKDRGYTAVRLPWIKKEL